MIQNVISNAAKNSAGLIQNGSESGKEFLKDEQKGLFGVLFKALSYGADESDVSENSTNENSTSESAINDNGAKEYSHTTHAHTSEKQEKIAREENHEPSASESLAGETLDSGVAGNGTPNEIQSLEQKHEPAKDDAIQDDKRPEIVQPPVQRELINSEPVPDSGEIQSISFDRDTNTASFAHSHPQSEGPEDLGLTRTDNPEKEVRNASVNEPVRKDQISRGAVPGDVPKIDVNQNVIETEAGSKGGNMQPVDRPLSAAKNSNPFFNFGKIFSEPGSPVSSSADPGKTGSYTPGSTIVESELKAGGLASSKMDTGKLSEKLQDFQIRQDGPAKYEFNNAIIEETQRGIALRNLRAEVLKEIRQLSDERASKNTVNPDKSTDRKPLLSLLNSSDNRLQALIANGGFFNQLQMGEAQADTEFASQVWKEFIPLLESMDDNQLSELSLQAVSRMAYAPVANLSVRKTVLPGLTQAVQQAVSSGKANGEGWQKHNFVMDDGKKIEVSVRQTDGVLQLKLASSSPELNKLLKQYHLEIREHLERECSVSIDLEFGGSGDDAGAQFSGTNPDAFNRGGAGRSFESGSDGTGNTDENARVTNTVRNFGYNRMEWTA